MSRLAEGPAEAHPGAPHQVITPGTAKAQIGAS